MIRLSFKSAALACSLLIGGSAISAPSLVQPAWGSGTTKIPRAIPVVAGEVVEAAPVVEDRAPRAIPATYGWGQPLQMKDRPKVTEQSTGPGEWAGEYNFGPGDTLNLALQGAPETIKKGIEIGPDGTLSYLQARGVMAKGKTVPQLRKALEEGLADDHEAPTVLIAPVKLKSKRFTILGKVRKSGSYALERPMTLLEAIAQSGGITIGASRLSVSELADLRRSFVVRARKKLPLDMERLYAQGDLTQNVYLEPGDYIYIASNVDQECYVLGSVRTPGEVPLDTPLTVTGAIAAVGGFNEKAWKAQVLIVRGNLSDPKTEVVDMRKILDGGGRDIGLQPGDIVYVNNRPWSFAEDLLDAAVRSFIQGSAAAAFENRTSVSVGR